MVHVVVLSCVAMHTWCTWACLALCHACMRLCLCLCTSMCPQLSNLVVSRKPTSMPLQVVNNTCESDPRQSLHPPVRLPACLPACVSLHQTERAGTDLHIQAQWQNLTRARFATEQTFTQYSPISVVDQVKAPLMIIAGKQELAALHCSTEVSKLLVSETA